ncbi:MAG: flagellar motor switch protein FliN [Planctomycetota bacterium]|nr:flagellar motor switch protein FliN [Planctomycetota bacterium]
MAGESEQIGQDEIEKLLAQARSSAPPPKPPAAADAPSTLGQEEIEALLRQNATAEKGSPARSEPAPRSSRPENRPAHAGGVAPGDIELLFNHAEQALASIQDSEPLLPGAAPFKLVDFSGATASADSATLDLLRDVELDLRIELGRTHMYLEDVLKLSKGAVVPLDRLAGDPVDIFINGRLIARGEVLILNDNFCVRVAELVAGESATA